MRKLFALSLLMVSLIFAAPVHAAAIIMECPSDDDGGVTVYKYERGPVGDTTFYLEGGKWIPPSDFPKISSSNGTTTTEFIFDAAAKKDYPASSLKKGEHFREHYKWVWDFRLFKYTHTQLMTHRDGSPITQSDQDGYMPRSPKYVHLCKRPDESWEDRRNR